MGIKTLIMKKFSIDEEVKRLLQITEGYEGPNQELKKSLTSELIPKFAEGEAAEFYHSWEGTPLVKYRKKAVLYYYYQSSNKNMQEVSLIWPLRLFVEMWARKNLRLFQEAPRFRKLMNGFSQANFLYKHRLMRGRLQAYCALNEQATIFSVWRSFYDSCPGKTTFYLTGTRVDQRFVGNEELYISLCRYLKDHFKYGYEIPSKVRDILMGKPLQDDIPVSVFLYRFVDLLFYLEPERNISAFVDNCIFMDLVERKILDITQLPDFLPMAMDGSVQASRIILQDLSRNLGFKLSSYDNCTKRPFIAQIYAYEMALRQAILHLIWLDQKVNYRNHESIKTIQLTLQQVHSSFDKTG